MFLYGVIKVELEKQNKQGFYTVVQEKKVENVRDSFRLEVFFGIDEFVM